MVIAGNCSVWICFSCGVASLANIGGVASAPDLGRRLLRALIPDWRFGCPLLGYINRPRLAGLLVVQNPILLTVRPLQMKNPTRPHFRPAAMTSVSCNHPGRQHP